MVFAFIVNMVFNPQKRHSGFAMQIPVSELKAAYKRTHLQRHGYTFTRAMECPVLKLTITRLAEIAMKKQAIAGNPAPMQLELIGSEHE